MGSLLCNTSNKSQVMKTIWVIVAVLGVVTLRVVECRKARRIQETLEYYAICCRALSTSITDFGVVGNGKTSNTKAFREAISQLSQYGSDGGTQLFVPPGQCLSDSFNLTSHFTLCLAKDAVLMASQLGGIKLTKLRINNKRGFCTISEWAVIEPLPPYDHGRYTAGGSAAIALGSEMSGGIEDVRAEDITAINPESGVRINTGRIEQEWDEAVTDLGDQYRDIIAENVSMATRLEGISGDSFTPICISNTTIGLAKKAKKVPWTCTDVEGVTSGVVPRPCGSLPDQRPEKVGVCAFPTENLSIHSVEIKKCSYRME
ncbi:hypothetical protein AgCh_005654 [Apium graveolens]